MNRLWNICAFVALVNLVALCGVLVWLFSTDRIDSDRVERLRVLFATPIPEELKAAEAERQAQELLLEQSLEEGSLATLPASSRWPIDSLSKIRMEEKMMQRRFRDELLRDSQEVLMAEQRLKADREAFEREKAEYLQLRDEAQKQRTAADFKQSVKDLESMPPRSAKNLIVEICATDPEGFELALQWMKAMRQGPRATIIASMKSEEELKLASSLLQSLAVPGTPGETDLETPDATSVTNAGNV
ncbi:MAG: hypothetical protein VX641_02450 [Planctomycetota bacterium]|nr:hypothetical protein [Planctomycetota bacterium]